jgi:hypothetical protein
MIPCRLSNYPDAVCPPLRLWGNALDRAPFNALRSKIRWSMFACMKSLESKAMSDQSQRRPQVSVRLGDELREAVEKRARAERRSVSNYIAALVASAIDRDQAAA